MSQDTLITLLMEKTYQVEHDVVRPSGLTHEGEFSLRRGLASQPVKAMEGVWTRPGFACFNMNGVSLELPMGHGPVRGWSREEGQVESDLAFLAASSQLLGEKFDRVLVIQSSGEKPWLVYWNSVERVDEGKLRELFCGARLSAAA